jgi:hypothetical protein
MKARHVSALSILLLSTCISRTQNVPTQQSIEAKLRGGPFLMLRGMWDGDKLAFDSQGNLIGNAEKTFFSRSAVVVTQIQLTNTQLEIRGRRAGLEFSYKSPVGLVQSSYPVKRIGAWPYGKNDFEITIVRDPQLPEALDAALDRVFSVGIDEKLAASAPYYWQSFLQRYLHHGDNLTSAAHDPGVRHPILKYAPEDLLRRAVNLLQVEGVSVVGLTVDTNGVPQDVHLVRPLGMGADEYAVAEVLQYRFTPAIYRSKAVPVEINIEVNFRR